MPDHDAPYECIVCGGPEWNETSMRGCSTCDAQDEIVPRGTRQKVLDHPEDVVETVDGDIVHFSIDGIVFAHARRTSDQIDN